MPGHPNGYDNNAFNTVKFTKCNVLPIVSEEKAK